MKIHIDADGCPVKPEVLKVARRYAIPVVMVANSGMEAAVGAEMVLVGQALDAADDWIVDHAEPGDIVVTSDIPLASRCVAKGVEAVHPNGRQFTEHDIGSALAMRDLLKQLRDAGERTRGPAPFRERDRSEFLQTLDQVIQRARRAQPRPAPARPAGPGDAAPPA